ncbi:glycosyltransferase family 2 protein [bacterium]|nr:glycosyltransferase family 2 protein [bacterium]
MNIQVAIIIPVFNEEQYIEEVVTGIPSWVRWIIAIDDCSDDLSMDILNKQKDSRLTVIKHQRNMGVGTAIVTGYRKAIESGAEIVVVMGGDGQMDPQDLEGLIEPILADRSDYVKGTRFSSDNNIRKIPFWRRQGIRFFTWLTKLASGCRNFTDAQCGYTAANLYCLQTLYLDNLYPGYGFPNDMIVQVCLTNLRLAEIPVHAIYRDEKSGIKPFYDLPRLFYRLSKTYLHRLQKIINQNCSSVKDGAS